MADYNDKDNIYLRKQMAAHELRSLLFGEWVQPHSSGLRNGKAEPLHSSGLRYRALTWTKRRGRRKREGGQNYKEIVNDKY